MHLRIGRQLHAACDKDSPAERVFAAVNQLNLAVDLIANAEDKIALLRLNVVAGMKAKAGIAYGAARDYLDTRRRSSLPMRGRSTTTRRSSCTWASPSASI